MRPTLTLVKRHVKKLTKSFPQWQRTYASKSETPTGKYDDKWDVVIVGGGPAGLAFASALVASPAVKESLRIALIEAGDLDRVRTWQLPEDKYSNRVSSITNASKGFLEDIGAWRFVDETCTSPIENMQVWDGVSDSRISFSASDLASLSRPFPVQDNQQMARLTENLNLQRALLRHLDETKSVKLLDNVKVDKIETNDEAGGWPVVRTSNGVSLRTRLLVGADGHNSPVRAYAGIGTYGWAYDTRAIVATLSHPPRVPHIQGPNTTAFQRFLPTGPIAFLPLSSTVSSLVWSTKPALATALINADPQVLVSMVNAAFRLPEVSLRYLHNIILEKDARKQQIDADELVEEIAWRERSHSIDSRSAYSSVQSDANSTGVPPSDAEELPPLVQSIQSGTIASFPLRFSHAESYIGEGDRGRTVLLGDAAHTVHPLAGQGLNMGLADAESLADSINNAVLLGGDIGSRATLHPYTRARYFENHKLLAATDKLHKLYSSTSPPIVWARSIGVEVLNELDTLKSALMINAGARVSQNETSGFPWEAAARSVETITSAVDIASLFGRALRGTALSSLKNISQSTYTQSR